MTKRPVNTSSNPFTKKRDVHVLMEHNVYVNMRKKLFESAMTFPEARNEEEHKNMQEAARARIQRHLDEVNNEIKKLDAEAK